MPWFRSGLAGILIFFCVACETDPVIYVDHSPLPVIFGVFNKYDTLHYLKVGRSFGAEKDPLVSAQVYDSLFFDERDVTVRITVDGISKKLVLVDNIPKEAGLFHFPGQRLYSFETKPKHGWRRIQLKVTVPGLPIAIGQIDAVDIGVLTTPKKGQKTIYLVPTSPWRVLWSGNPWNEIDVAFEFIEDLGSSMFQSKWVHIQNTNYFDSPHDQYREMKITYDEFIREVLLQIPQNDSVKQIFFGQISISIHGGDDNMVKYMKYLNGYNDFNFQDFSNIENGLGLLASRSTFTLDSLHFDYQSRQALMKENRLKVLKISPWN